MKCNTATTKKQRTNKQTKKEWCSEHSWNVIDKVFPEIIHWLTLQWKYTLNENHFTDYFWKAWQKGRNTINNEDTPLPLKITLCKWTVDDVSLLHDFALVQNNTMTIDLVGAMLHASHSTNSATKWWTHWYKTVLACQTSMHIITLSDTVAKTGIMCVYGWLSITSKLLFGVLRIPPNEFCCGYNERCSRQPWHEQSHWRSDGWDASQLCYKAVPGSGLFLKHANVYNEPVIENEMCHLFGIAAPHLGWTNCINALCPVLQWGTMEPVQHKLGRWVGWCDQVWVFEEWW